MPSTISGMTVRFLARRRTICCVGHRRLAYVVLVALVAVGCAPSHPRDQASSPIPPAGTASRLVGSPVAVGRGLPASAPGDLIGVAWKLQQIRPIGRPYIQLQGSDISLKFYDHGGVSGDCAGATASVTAGRIVFHQAWVMAMVLNRKCIMLRGAQAKWFFGVLSGTVSWSIANGQLIITKPHVGSLAFQG
jgi:hypothetical protein